MGLRLSIGEASACGPRTENQDALRVVTPAPALAASKGHLLAIADGVSQCADGGLAARSSLQALALDYYATPETWAIVQSLDRLLLAQNRWLQANGGGQPLLTTLTALVLRGTRYTLAHVGDCRAYLWRDGELLRQTSDHVWEQPHMQHVLTRALGLDQHLVVDYLEGDLEPGSQWLLVSDGVWATLGDSGIRSILRNAEEPQRSAEALVRAAHLAGSQDNASALLVRVEAVPAGSLGDALAQLGHWPLPPPLKPDQLFEGWRVRQLLGESRQSLLYRVEDGQGQPWLLKTLPAARADDPLATQALLLEEWFLRRVQGRHFPELHGLAQRQHLYYLMREHPERLSPSACATMARCRCRSGWGWPTSCCAGLASCIDATCCTATSSRKISTSAVTASCACWISAWPGVRDCRAKTPICYRVRPATWRRNASPAPRPRCARISTPPASASTRR